MESRGNSPASGASKSNKKTIASSASAKPKGKSTASSATVMKPRGKSIASSAILRKPVSAATLSSAHSNRVMFFRDVSPGPHAASLRFRLIHYWEARIPRTKTLLGLEMLLIDEEGTIIQGFIPPGRVGIYNLMAGSVYNLANFFGSSNKDQYRVSDHRCTVSFSWNSVLTVLEDIPVPISEDRFRFHSYEEFHANSDLKGDLYDFVGHMKLVNGQTIVEHNVLDEVDIAHKGYLLVHVQAHGGPVMKLYLWDQAATEFCQKYKSYGCTPSVLLVTTLNPKHHRGTFALASMSPSRMFMDNDVQPTREYLTWLSSNKDIANQISVEVVTKPEIVTIGDLYSYIKKPTAKVAWFECLATIDDVFHGSAWYYISCAACNSKAVKGTTSMICENMKCKMTEIAGVRQYLTKISVYDNSEQAVFVILNDAGRELTGKHASELVAEYFEANEASGPEECVPVPHVLSDNIGQERKFIVKVSELNLSGKVKSITVTNILPLEPQPSSDENVSSSGEQSDPPMSSEDPACDMIRKGSESLASDEAKRFKCG